MWGPGALQCAASPSRATQGELQVDLSGWPAALRKPPSLWKMRALFQDLPGGGWNLLWTGRLPQECCLRRWRGVCCTPGSGAQEVPAAARARRRPGPVSLRHISVMDLSAPASAGASALCCTVGAACSLPRSGEPRAISKQSRFSAEMCTAWKFAGVGNIFPLETNRRRLPSHCSGKETEESQDVSGRSHT